jgi:hypothetical protein
MWLNDDGNLKVRYRFGGDSWEVTVRSDFREATLAKVVEAQGGDPTVRTERTQAEEVRKVYVEWRREVEYLSRREELLRKHLPELAPTRKEIEKVLRDMPKKRSPVRTLQRSWKLIFKLIELNKELDEIEQQSGEDNR